MARGGRLCGRGTAALLRHRGLAVANRSCFHQPRTNPLAIDYKDFGFLRVRAAVPRVALGNPQENARRILADLEADRSAAALVLYPELSLTGYSAEDLLHAEQTLDDCRTALDTIAAATRSGERVVIVGLPWQVPDGRLFNCAAVLAGGRCHGLVPKCYPPNYGEFYEARWFTSGAGVVVEEPLPLRTDQLFQVGAYRFAIELCEDLWAPAPPSTNHALAGAELLLNLSASNEAIAKADYRRDLVRMTSARLLGAYLYVSSGPTESTKDIVFGGHVLAAENGTVLAESQRFELDGCALVTEFDLARLRHERRHMVTFGQSARPAPYRTVPLPVTAPALPALTRTFTAQPFVPADEAELDARAQEVLAIQATGLARRLLSAQAKHMVIGLSGGLDSTLAFLVCLEAAAKLRWKAETIHAITMPGPGTSSHTFESVKQLSSGSGVTLVEIPIDAAVSQHLRDLSHDGVTHDVVFENAQARERTQLLFNYANQHHGLVVGTGDLSELALGWCTFNADHMAGYNVNASVPKTMIAYLVRWYRNHRANAALQPVLERVLATPISPELIPSEDDAIGQHTEALVGPYELHDFFLYHYLRHGTAPRKLFALARLAFADRYEPQVIARWLKEFFRRFFVQQFKRTTLPPGPKVGTVSLSPRGDWRMPDEASAAAVLDEIDHLLD